LSATIPSWPEESTSVAMTRPLGGGAFAVHEALHGSAPMITRGCSSTRAATLPLGAAAFAMQKAAWLGVRPE
jgi:hypothetical protein